MLDIEASCGAPVGKGSHGCPNTEDAKEDTSGAFVVCALTLLKNEERCGSLVGRSRDECLEIDEIREAS